MARSNRAETDWKINGVRVIAGGPLDSNTPQTPGMSRAAAINKARVSAEHIGPARCIEPQAKTARIIMDRSRA